MKLIGHTSIRKSIALAVSLAALAVPATASAYPLIPDEPGDAAAAAGHDWMAQHPHKRPQRNKPSSKPTQTCHPKAGKASCPKP